MSSKGESLGTPEALNCNHVWKRVVGETETKDGILMVCERCGASRMFSPPVKEEKKDERSIIME